MGFTTPGPGPKGQKNLGTSTHDKAVGAHFGGSDSAVSGGQKLNGGGPAETWEATAGSCSDPHSSNAGSYDPNSL